MTRHAIKRARERYGLELTDEDIREMGRRIAAGEGVVLMRWPCGAERVLIDHAGTAMIVVFDRPTRAVITVVPPGIRTRRKTTPWRRQTKNKYRRTGHRPK